MVDIHTHVLPGIDDGSKSPEMSLEMLRESKAQGVDTVIATSHCYLKHEDDVDDFLKRQKESYKLLMDNIKHEEELPDIKLGCELKIETDFSGFKNIDKLCIEGTNYILIEMPYTAWMPFVYDVLYNLTIHGFRPIMAHIDRFYTHKDDFKNLWDLDLIYQINADSFIIPKVRKIMPFYFKNNMVQLIGSDMHNTNTRPQRIGEAYNIIDEYYGKECTYYLKKNSDDIINNKSIEFHTFKKKNVFKRKFSKE